MACVGPAGPFGAQRPGARGREGMAQPGAAPCSLPGRLTPGTQCRTPAARLRARGLRRAIAGPRGAAVQKPCTQKQYTHPGEPIAFLGFIFLVFPLTARFFRLIMLIMYHHGLVCPCAKKMPKIFVHFDDFCPGRRAALRGVTKKRNMLKK